VECVDQPELTLLEDGFAEREPALAAVAAAAVSGRLPAGPELRQRPPVSLRGEVGVEVTAPLAVTELGFSLHAATTVRADDLQGREALVRYALRPPLAQERLHRLPDGLVRIELKRPFRDGTVAVDLTLAVAPVSASSSRASAALPPGALRGGSGSSVEVEGSGRAATTAAAGAGFERSSDPAPLYSSLAVSTLGGASASNVRD